MPIEVGCLLRNRFNDTLWLALDEIAESVLIINQKTNNDYSSFFVE